VALSGTGGYHFDERVVEGARRWFSEFEMAELTAIGAEPHDARWSVGRA